jgi:hypothetical protein
VLGLDQHAVQAGGETAGTARAAGFGDGQLMGCGFGDMGRAGTGMEVWPGRPWPLGATPGEAGTNFAVVSEVAEQVVLCLFEESGAETRLPLPGFDGGVWHGFVPGSAAASGMATG